MAIEITSQFNNKAGKPLDVNSVKATIAERDAIPIDERYSGIEVFVIQTLKKYIQKHMTCYCRNRIIRNCLAAYLRRSDHMRMESGRNTTSN